MTTKHKPATPLPWAYWKEAGYTNIGRKGEFVVGQWAGLAEDKENAKYIAHACNKYPKLVDALRSCVKIMQYDPAQDDALDILRELGEL